MKSDAAVGKAIQAYRDHLEAALAWSNDMADSGFERPWITVKCKREECASLVLITTEGIKEHTHRIRLEIR